MGDGVRRVEVDEIAHGDSLEGRFKIALANFGIGQRSGILQETFELVRKARVRAMPIRDVELAFSIDWIDSIECHRRQVDQTRGRRCRVNGL